MTSEEDPQALPTAVAQRNHVPLVWLAPVVAALIGIWLAIHAIANRGPTVTITFKDADGISVGKTKVRYKSVDIGIVKEITIDRDHRNVHVAVDIANFARPFLVSDTRFWIVRPRLGASGFSGLETLVTGAYIGMDVGQARTAKRDFVGLDTPPVVTGDTTGKEFILQTADLGSLNIDAPIYFHHIQVGEISAIALNEDGRGITLKIFVHAPYDRFVTEDSRFWHASGIDMAVDSSGIRLFTESVATILAGGIAFEEPAYSNSKTSAPADAQFQLAGNRELAMKPPDRVVETYVLYFDESLRGLTPGALVDFQGITIGEVTALHAEYTHREEKFLFPVLINIYPERIRARFRKPSDQSGMSSHALVAHMINRGYRAQLRSANLLTGQLYIALDLFPRAAKVTPQTELDPMPLPTVPGNLDAMQKTLMNVALKLDRLPLEKIGRDADAALVSLNKTLGSTNLLINQVNQDTAAPEATLPTDLHATLTSIGRAADSVRVLTDYLDQHPESLLRGKTKEDQ